MADPQVVGRAKVSIVILSYSRPEYLPEVLDSVLAQTYPGLEVILLDNWSSKSAEIGGIALTYPSILFVPNAENVGFAQGMNQAVGRATGDYVFLTEDDIILDRNCVENFVSYAAIHPEIAILSGLQYNKHDGVVRSAGATIELGGVFRKKLLWESDQDNYKLRAPYETQFVPGSMIFAKASYLRQMGPFRPDFFVYFEDTELCIRARRLGGKIMILPQAKSWHIEPAEGQHSNLVDFHKIKNFLSLYLIHASPLVLPEFFTRYVLFDLARSFFNDRRRFSLILRAAFYLSTRLKGLLSSRFTKLANDGAELAILKEDSNSSAPLPSPFK